MALDDTNERARLAGNILGNPIFDEAFVVLREGYTQAMMKCEPRDDVGRHRYAFALRDLETIRAHLETVLQTGKIAAIQAEEFKQRESPFKRAVRGFY